MGKKTGLRHPTKSISKKSLSRFMGNFLDQNSKRIPNYVFFLTGKYDTISAMTRLI